MDVVMENKLTLKQLILNKIQIEPWGYATELAKISGSYNSAGNLNKVLEDEGKEFKNFQGLVNIVEYIWKNESVEKMSLYANEVNPSKKTAHNLLEYLLSNRAFESFNILLDRMEKCSNAISKEYAKVYRLFNIYEAANKAEDYDHLLKEITESNTSVLELKVLKKFLMNYCFERKNNFNMTVSLTEAIESEIYSIENEYIKNRYILRLDEVMSYNSLRVENNPEKSRNYALHIIDNTNELHFHGYANFIIGLSYLYTSYEKAINYLEASKEAYKEMSRPEEVLEIEQQIEFTKVYWGKFEGKCQFEKNQLLLNVKNGNEVIIGEDIQPEYNLFIKGLIVKNEKLLMLSLIKYMKNNDKFFANLPKLELLKQGYDEDILFELIG
jgi:hypothetical protein